MAAITTVDQQIIEKNSLEQQAEIQKEMKYQCKQCDFETTWKVACLHIMNQYIWEEGLNVRSVTTSLLRKVDLPNKRSLYICV